MNFLKLFYNYNIWINWWIFSINCMKYLIFSIICPLKHIMDNWVLNYSLLKYHISFILLLKYNLKNPLLIHYKLNILNQISQWLKLWIIEGIKVELSLIVLLNGWDWTFSTYLGSWLNLFILIFLIFFKLLFWIDGQATYFILYLIPNHIN